MLAGKSREEAWDALVRGGVAPAIAEMAVNGAFGAAESPADATLAAARMDSASAGAAEPTVAETVLVTAPTELAGSMVVAFLFATIELCWLGFMAVSSWGSIGSSDEGALIALWNTAFTLGFLAVYVSVLKKREWARLLATNIAGATALTTAGQAAMISVGSASSVDVTSHIFGAIVLGACALALHASKAEFANYPQGDGEMSGLSRLLLVVVVLGSWVIGKIEQSATKNARGNVRSKRRPDRRRTTAI